MSTIKQLYTFIAVAETLHMSAAAKRLYISQPTVSLMISELEKEYNAVFFDRSGRRLSLTTAGSAFLRQAYQVTQEYERLETLFQAPAARRGLRAGATVTIGNTLMPRIMSRLLREKPDIQPHIVVDNTSRLEGMLLSGELDIALIEGSVRSQMVTRMPLVEDSLVVVCSRSHPFCGRERITPADLRNQNFILREQGSGTRRLFEAFMQTARIPVNVIAESSNSTAILEMVVENLGISVLSSRCVERYAKLELLHACTVEDMPMKRLFYICYHSGSPVSSQMTDLIQAAKDEMAGASRE